MKNLVLYAAPNFTENAVRFIEAFVGTPGIAFGLISHEPQELLPPPLRARVAGHWRVENCFDVDQLVWAARSLAGRHGPPHRIIAAVEQLQEAVAEARERLGIEGMRLETIRNFRDKARMKALLRAAGLPCARHCLAGSPGEARAFAGETGFPLVVKPPDGAGSQATFKVEHEHDLERVLQNNPPAPSRPVLFEEFITGEEYSFDTFSLNGRPLFHSLTHYYPTPLDVMRNPWIQWQVVLPREVDDARYDDIRDAALRTLDVLGMQTGMSHLEWFRRRDGSIAISEVAARPPGAQIPTLIARANDFDAHAAWVRLMVFGEFDVPQRRYAAGCAYLRGQGEGRVAAVEGIEQVRRELGHLICDERLPRIGQPKSLSYEGEGFIIVRHLETEVVKEALKYIVSTVRVRT
jgi:biotin carboxylase